MIVFVLFLRVGGVRGLLLSLGTCSHPVRAKDPLPVGVHISKFLWSVINGADISRLETCPHGALHIGPWSHFLRDEKRLVLGVHIWNFLSLGTR